MPAWLRQATDLTQQPVKRRRHTGQEQCQQTSITEFQLSDNIARFGTSVRYQKLFQILKRPYVHRFLADNYKFLYTLSIPSPMDTIDALSYQNTETLMYNNIQNSPQRILQLNDPVTHIVNFDKFFSECHPTPSTSQIPHPNTKFFDTLIKNISQRPIGNNVKRLLKNKYILHCTTLSFPISLQSTPEQIQEKILLFLSRLLHLILNYWTFNPNSDPTTVTFESILEANTAPSTKFLPVDFPYSTPGKSNMLENGIMWHPRVLQVVNTLGTHTTLAPARLHSLPESMTVGNPLICFFSEKHKKNFINNPFAPPQNINPLASLNTSHLLALLSKIKTSPPFIRPILMKFFLPALNELIPYHLTINLLQALRLSSLKTYLNNLNTIAEFFIAQQRCFEIIVHPISKTDILLGLQNKLISPVHLQQVLEYMRHTKQSAPSTMRNTYAAWSFFYKHFHQEPLSSHPGFLTSIQNIKRIDWRFSDAAFPLNHTQIIRMQEILHDLHPPMSYLITIGAAFITRTSDIRSILKFPDFKYEKMIYEGQEETFLILHMDLAKNSRVPQRKVFCLNDNMILNPAKALEALRKIARDQKGQICINTDGSHMSTRNFDTILRKAFQVLVSETPSLAKKKLTWYSFRKGMIISGTIYGLTPEELKSVTLHSKNSTVLQKSYISAITNMKATFMKPFHEDFANIHLHNSTHPKKLLLSQVKTYTKQIEKLFKQLRSDLIKELQLRNLLNQRHHGIQKEPITSSLLSNICNGQLPPSPPPPPSPSPPFSDSEEFNIPQYSSPTSSDSESLHVLPNPSSISPDNSPIRIRRTSSRSHPTSNTHIKTFLAQEFPLAHIDWSSIKFNFTPSSEILRDIHNLSENLNLDFQNPTQARDQFKQISDLYLSQLGNEAKVTLSNIWTDYFVNTLQ